MKTMFCPRCGTQKLVLAKSTSKCVGCTWKVYWWGPLWGESLR